MTGTPVHTRQYLPRVVMPRPREIKKAIGEVEVSTPSLPS